MSDTVILRNFAVDMIKRNNFNKARLALLKSIGIDGTVPDTYTLLGDVMYLSSKPKTAMQCYLAAMHLQINKFKNLQSSTFSDIIDLKFNKLSEEAKKLLPSKYGVVVFDDYTIAEHMAHSAVDLKKDVQDIIVKECTKVYREHLITRQTIPSIINKHNIVLEDYFEFRQSHYISIGHSLLIDGIHWDSIDCDKVYDIYLKK